MKWRTGKQREMSENKESEKYFFALLVLNGPTFFSCGLTDSVFDTYEYDCRTYNIEIIVHRIRRKIHNSKVNLRKFEL